MSDKPTIAYDFAEIIVALDPQRELELRDRLLRIGQALADLPHLEAIAGLVADAKAIRGVGRGEQSLMSAITSKLYRAHDELERARLARQPKGAG